jgi:hypothetical protein
MSLLLFFNQAESRAEIAATDSIPYDGSSPGRPLPVIWDRDTRIPARFVEMEGSHAGAHWATAVISIRVPAAAAHAGRSAAIGDMRGRIVTAGHSRGASQALAAVSTTTQLAIAHRHRSTDEAAIFFTLLATIIRRNKP